MALNPVKISRYLRLKHHLKMDVEQCDLLVKSYTTGSKELQSQISMIFMVLFELSIETINELAKDSLTSVNTVDTTIKELSGKINTLAKEITELRLQNEELKENYWKLNQSVIQYKV